MNISAHFWERFQTIAWKKSIFFESNPERNNLTIFSGDAFQLFLSEKSVAEQKTSILHLYSSVKHFSWSRPNPTSNPQKIEFCIFSSFFARYYFVFFWSLWTRFSAETLPKC